MDCWVPAPVHTPVLGISVEEPWGSHDAEKQKIVFLLDRGAHFSVLPFSPSPRSNDKSYYSGQIWSAPRTLVYLASGLLLGRPPLLSFFLYSSWNSNASAGMGFTILTKSSNSPPPRQQFLLTLPSGANRCHSVDWWHVGWARLALPIQIKLKNPSQFPHPKQYPLNPEGQWGLKPIINSLKQQGLLIICFSLYNKSKIFIKVNFKIQVIK
jgi:hypothetical protein